jgi:hypothetical protein
MQILKMNLNESAEERLKKMPTKRAKFQVRDQSPRKDPKGGKKNKGPKLPSPVTDGDPVNTRGDRLIVPPHYTP